MVEEWFKNDEFCSTCFEDIELRREGSDVTNSRCGCDDW